MIKSHLRVLVIFVTLGFMIPCISRASEPLRIVVSIVPQKYFVKKIAQSSATVSVMVPPGSNPATYEPKPTQMRALVHSKIYFAIGVPFEKVWLRKIMGVNPGLQVVYTDQSISKRKLAVHPHAGDKNRKSQKVDTHRVSNKEGDLDPHIWLSPTLVKLQAQIIAEALIKMDPAREDNYEHNLRVFQAELDHLDSELGEIFKGKEQGVEFLVFHPSWGYFAEAYGLKQITVEIEGKEPSATEMARLIRYAKGKGIKIIFVQPQFSTKSAEAIAREIGARIVIADPLHEDWANNLREVAARFRAALR